MKIEVTQEIRDLIDLIDKKYQEAKKVGLSRFSVEWGKWSREMNVELRRKMLRKKEGILFKYVFIYWTLKSRLLEVFFKSPSRMLKRGCKKRFQREADDIKEIILSGNMPEGELTDKDLLKILLEK